MLVTPENDTVEEIARNSIPRGPARKEESIVPVKTSVIRHPAHGDPEMEYALIDICLADMECRIQALSTTLRGFLRGVEELQNACASVGAMGMLEATTCLQNMGKHGELRRVMDAVDVLRQEYDRVRAYLREELAARDNNL